MSKKSERTIKATKSSWGQNCINIDASVGGRTTRWTVCAIGAINDPAALSINRRGRRGGAKSADKSPGGMVACSAKGERSKCVKAQHGAIVFPGGAAKLKRKNVDVLDGLKTRSRKKKR